jgi:hypothetical protein
MKKLVLGLVMASMFIGTVVLGSASLNGPHKGKTGKDGATINCAYCHVKAGNPKAGKDYAKYKTGPFCKGSGCH